MQQTLRTLCARPSTAVMAVLLAFTVSACNQNGAQNQTATAGSAPPALPLTTGAETAPVTAPSAEALPSAPRPRIVRVASQADQYAYVDQAQAMGSALGSAPPDYAFDYQGVHPWVWHAGSGGYRFVEPVDGGYRYYYYRAGSPYPYLIRDPRYAYGFNGQQLVVVYDANGNPLPPQYMDQRADWAGRYLARAYALYESAQGADRRAVIAANWAARRSAIDAQQAEWAQQRAQDAEWQAYHDQHEAEMQSYWQDETARREAAAQRFDQWQSASYQGPPPPPAYGPGAVVGAAAAGGVIGALLAGHHNDRGPPQSQPTSGFNPGGPHYAGAPGGPGYNPGGPNQGGPNQGGIDQARRDQAAQDAQRQAEAQQQAQAAAQARQQALAQGRSQQAAADAARQAQAEQQARQVSDARHQQQLADQQQQQRQQAAAQQAHQQQQAQATQVREQQQSQAAAQHQAEAGQRAQAEQARQQQIAQAASQRQAEAGRQAQAEQARQQQAMAQRQAAGAAHAQAAQQAAAQHQAEAAARAQVAQAHQQQAAQAAAQHQAQAAQAGQAAAAAHAQAAQAAAAAAHPNGGPHPGGEHGPHKDPNRPQP